MLDLNNLRPKALQDEWNMFKAMFDLHIEGRKVTGVEPYNPWNRGYDVEMPGLLFGFEDGYGLYVVGLSRNSISVTGVGVVDTTVTTDIPDRRVLAYVALEE